METESFALLQKAEKIRALKDKYRYYQNLAKALEDFYGLKEFRQPHFLGETLLEKQDSDKFGQIPGELISGLEELCLERVVGNTIPDISDLSYEKVRESFYLYDNPPVPKNFTGDFLIRTATGIIGGVSGFVLAFPVTLEIAFDSDPYQYTQLLCDMFTSFTVGSTLFISSVIYTHLIDIDHNKKREGYIPQQAKDRRKAFFQLHKNAGKAECFLRDYESLIQRI